ncbi:MAG: hypothetical protein OFPII_39110 [Osedax symbiont Rs1]|nr:MAG: hypothetical protein OFPII_39110 [Osedax symbiont Rs1]
MRFKVIFVAGVHGVGKGTVCGDLAKKYGLATYSASQLIKSVKKSSVDINKVVLGASENQDYLSIALSNLSPSSSTILLDGHFCLNSDDGIFQVPFSVFESLDLEAIFLITESPSLILSRLLARDTESMGFDVIKQLQILEVERAKLVANKLNVPLVFCEQGDTNHFVKYLNTGYRINGVRVN